MNEERTGDHSETDAEFVRAFESCELPAEEWTHAAHLRLAFLYLRRFSFEVSLEKLRAGIRRYNASLGKAPTRYHETITVAMATLVARRMAATGPATFRELERDHPDLFVWDPPVLLGFYSRRRLLSKKARRTFLSPDLAALE